MRDRTHRRGRRGRGGYSPNQPCDREQRPLFLTKRARLLIAHCGWANTQTFRRYGLDLSIQAEPLTQEICCAVANNDHCSLPNAHAYLLLTVDGQIHRLFEGWLGFVNPSRAVDPRNLLRCREQRSLFLTKRARLLTAHCGWANTQIFEGWLGFVNPSRAVDPRNLLRCSEQRPLFLTKRAAYLLLTVDGQIHRLFDYGLDLSIQAEPLTQEICCAVANNDHFSLPSAPAYLLLSVDGQIHRTFVGIRLGFGNPSRAVDPRNLLRCSEQRSLFLTKRARLLTAHCGWANTQTFRDTAWICQSKPSVL